MIHDVPSPAQEPSITGQYLGGENAYWEPAGKAVCTWPGKDDLGRGHGAVLVDCGPYPLLRGLFVWESTET